MHTPNWFEYIKFLFVENDMPKTKSWIHSEMFMRGSGGGGGSRGPDPPLENKNVLNIHSKFIANMPRTPWQTHYSGSAHGMLFMFYAIHLFFIFILLQESHAVLNVSHALRQLLNFDTFLRTRKLVSLRFTYILREGFL